MTDIEAKALALVNEICLEKGVIPYAKLPNIEASEALCRTIEQHEAFKQEVSGALLEYYGGYHNASGEPLEHFIIPKPKPDPLVEIMEVLNGEWTPDEYANAIRAALEARGLEIREKGQ